MDMEEAGEGDRVGLSWNPLFNGVLEEGIIGKGRIWGPASHKDGCKVATPKAPVYFCQCLYPRVS